MTRLSLRRVGALTGKLAAAPGSLSELLALATKKLKLASSATRLFASSGDELEDDDDVLLLREEEVVYVSCGEDFSPPTMAPSMSPALDESCSFRIDHIADQRHRVRRAWHWHFLVDLRVCLTKFADCLMNTSDFSSPPAGAWGRSVGRVTVAHQPRGSRSVGRVL